MAQASEFAQRYGLLLHLDGARVFNAATELGVEVKEIVRHVDSVSICFSKGLGAPVGSLLCGSGPFIVAAKRWRKMAGGGLRQAGVLAAAINYALDHHVDRLRYDHAHAKRLAQAVSRLMPLHSSAARPTWFLSSFLMRTSAFSLGNFWRSAGLTCWVANGCVW